MIHNPLKNSRSGFTLIELLIAIAIAGIALGAIYSVFASAQKTNTSNEVTARVMQSLRTSIDLMESDIRMAGLRGLIDIPGVGIEEATATKLRFTADRNMDGGLYQDRDGNLLPLDLSDGVQEQDIERITYLYDAASKQLRQCLSEGTADESWETVAENVENFSFSFLDENNNVTATTSLIRTVEIFMEIKQPAGRAGYIHRKITRRIFCRNLAM
jgi:type IV pilus assembly protein PilW